jgi:NADH-quinone oxidoreductase subunit J
MYLVFNGNVNIDAPIKADDYNNIVELAKILYTKYVLQFELAAVILLVAIIASIALVYRPSKNRKMQDIGKQIATRPKSRLKIIKGVRK